MYKYKSVEDFDNDLFEVQRFFTISDDATISYSPSDSDFGVAIVFDSPVSYLTITLLFTNPINANAWFVSLAYCIKLSPQLLLPKDVI